MRPVHSRVLVVGLVIAPAVAIGAVPAAAATKPTLKTTASAGVTVGKTISDTAVLSGGDAPTGSITFKAYPPSQSTCSGAPAFTSTKTVAGNSTYHSASFTTKAAGTYRFVASYSGDTNNSAVTEPCGSTGESVTVSAVKPTITTTASAPVEVGKAISDSAVLAGGQAPTGTISFKAYGPDDATCSGTPAVSSTKTVTGNKTYGSGDLVPKRAGEYRFVVRYSGDAANAAVADSCGAANETVTVSKVHPKVTATASADTTIGHDISDTVVIAGGHSPTGTITAAVYGPNATSCTGTPAATSAVPVSGNGTYHPAAFHPTAIGGYQYVTSYSGDANNLSTKTDCSATSQQVTVSQASSSLSITLSAPSAAYGNEQLQSVAATLTSDYPAVAGTGTVLVIDSRSGRSICTITLANGTGSCALSPTALPAGRYSIYGSFQGNANTKSSMSASHPFVVDALPTHTHIAVSRHHVRYGHERATRLDVTVSAAGLTDSPDGRVIVTSRGLRLCKIDLAAGHGHCRLGHRRLPVGRHHLVAQYLGAASLLPSRSAHRRIRVTAH